MSFGADMAAFDRLPPPVRAALHEAILPLRADFLLSRYRRLLRNGWAPALATEIVLGWLADWDADLVAISGPHAAARATIMRYHARGHRGRG
jgi:hypothetical protein